MVPGASRHVPVIGGITAWLVPLVATLLALGALGLGLLDMVAIVAALGVVAQTVLRGLVVELTPRGLTRGFALSGRFIGPTTVMPWSAVASVHTDWRRPGDDTALATTVRDGQGRAIHFTTAMGLSAYWACLGAVVAAAPAARRLGLTDSVLANDPPGRRSALSAAATAGVLGLVIVAVAGLHYLWAQGRSSFSRTLEQLSSPASLPPSSGPASGRDR